MLDRDSFLMQYLLKKAKSYDLMNLHPENNQWISGAWLAE
tara:strand:- start:2739 stop:2858 length:120 start_codon:yes stop_codon:yes gene_type:complete